MPTGPTLVAGGDEGARNRVMAGMVQDADGRRAFLAWIQTTAFLSSLLRQDE